MKFSLASLSLLAWAPLAVLAQAAAEPIINEPEVNEPVVLTKFKVIPVFADKSDVLHLINDKEIPVTFEFVNDEEFPVQVSAFGGAFRLPGKFEPFANVSDISCHIHVRL